MKFGTVVFICFGSITKTEFRKKNIDVCWEELKVAARKNKK